MYNNDIYGKSADKKQGDAGHAQMQSVKSQQSKQRTPEQQRAYNRRKRERYLKKKRKIMRMRICFASVVVLLLLVIGLLVKKLLVPDTATVDAPVVEAEEENIKTLMEDVSSDAVSVNKYYVYGTHLNMQGTLTAAEEIKTLELVFKDEDAVSAKKEEEKSVAANAYTEESSTEEELEDIYVLNQVDNGDGTISFSTGDLINEGINLETIADGNYCVLLKAIYVSGNSEYLSLTNTNNEDDITYYTLTKNGKNQKIDLTFEQDTDNTNYNYLQMTVADTTLPDDIYDVVIDAGHGGTDTGAYEGDYTEAEIVLSYAKKLKTSLEAKGLKVKLTRDGSEDPSTKMAYTMYDSDGRVTVSYESGAKYALSLHLNGNADGLTHGGVQVYCSTKGNSDFAQIVADNLVSEAGTDYSTMQTYRTVNGVYQRAYTEDDITKQQSSAASAGREAYNTTTDTDYLFMIRELGGIATGAYIDGRDTRYGENVYRNSNVGVECCLVEMGFMCIQEDLENLISNPDGYVQALTDAICQQVENAQNS